MLVQEKLKYIHMKIFILKCYHREQLPNSPPAQADSSMKRK